jgi:cell wall assembly regulator SMI1
MRALTWLDPRPPTDPRSMRAVESALGVVLPDDYRAFILAHGGGAPSETAFALDDARKGGAGLGEFLRADEQGGAASLLEARRLLPRLPGEIVPIAAGAGGDYVCLDYRRGPRPTVVYWHHERAGARDEYTHVANRFSEFLELLHPADPDDEAGETPDR